MHDFSGNHLLGFIRHLRQEGYNIGIQETLDVFKTLGPVAEADNPYRRLTLRALACHNHYDWQRFNDLYNHFWFRDKTANNSKAIKKRFVPAQNKLQPGITGISGESQDYTDLIRDMGGISGSGAGRQRTITKADFRFLNDRRAARDVERIAERLARLLKNKLRRRRIISSHGNIIDIRKTLRSNIKFGGTPIRPVYSKRRHETPHIIILHDVSHSMAWNNPLLFRFTRGLTRVFSTSEAFAFHTRLFRVTDLYRERSLEIMRARLEARNHLWLGGTCIADSIKEFIQQFGKKCIHPDSIMMIISDGFDTNEPEHLGNQLQYLKSVVKKILWLNPMFGREGFEADENFLHYAVPHLDFLGSAHSIESLEKVIYYLAATRN